MLEWLLAHQAVLWWLAASSVALFVVAAILVPVLVVRIPRDYFAAERRRPPPWARYHPLLRGMLLALKNGLGLLLLLAGGLMLVLPGQGVITILAALMLLDFPGKFRLERWIATREPVFRSINWLRRRRGYPPLAP